MMLLSEKKGQQEPAAQILSMVVFRVGVLHHVNVVTCHCRC